MGEKILVLSGDPAVRETVRLHMEAEGYDCRAADSELTAVFLSYQPDLIVVDLEATSFDPLQAAADMQALRPVPVIYLTDGDKQQGISLRITGSADKASPMDVANIGSLLRLVDEQYMISRREPPADSVYTCGALQVNLSTKEVSLSGRAVHLSAILRNMLVYLIRHEGQYVTKQELYENVWKNPVTFNSNAIMVQIRNLRVKIEKENPAGERYIFTKRGVGYTFSCRHNTRKKG